MGEPGPAVAGSVRGVAEVIWPVDPGSADVPISVVVREVSVVVRVVSAGVPAGSGDVPVIFGDARADLEVGPSRRRDRRRQPLDEWPASMPSEAS